MKTQILKELGFTNGEIKVYTTLLKLGKSTSGKIVDKSQVSKSKVYEILERLSNKGVVSQVIENNVKTFQAMHPRELLTYYESKENEFKKNKEELKNVLPEYEHLYNSNSENEITVYRGYDGIRNVHDVMIEDLKQGDTLYIFVTPVTPKDYTYFYEFDRRMVENKVKLETIFHDKCDMEDIKHIQKTYKKLAKVKLLGDGFKTPTTVNLFKDKTALVMWTDNPTAILIHNKETAESFKKYFDVLWSMAKEVS